MDVKVDQRSYQIFFRATGLMNSGGDEKRLKGDAHCHINVRTTHQATSPV